MKDKFIFFLILILAIGYVGYKNTASQKTAQIQTVKQMSLATYKGLLPCADCEGIQVELTLNNGGDYVQKYTYLGTNSKPFISVGNWKLIKDKEENPIYELDQAKVHSKTYFLRIDANKILQLDSNMKKIDTDLNFTLTKE